MPTLTASAVGDHVTILRSYSLIVVKMQGYSLDDTAQRLRFIIEIYITIMPRMVRSAPDLRFLKGVP